MNNKKRIISRVFALAFALVALCVFFAVSASAEKINVNMSLSAFNFDAPTADYTDIDVRLEGYSGMYTSPVTSYYNCNVDYVYYEGDWCFRISPRCMPDGTEYWVEFDFGDEAWYSYIGTTCSALFELVDTDFPANMPKAKITSSITHNIGGEVLDYVSSDYFMYYNGIHYMKFQPPSDNTNFGSSKFGKIRLTFTHTSMGQSIYFKGFSFGSIFDIYTPGGLYFNKDFDSNKLPVCLEFLNHNTAGEGGENDYYSYVTYMYDLEGDSVNLVDLYEAAYVWFEKCGGNRASKFNMKLFYEPFESDGNIGYAIYCLNHFGIFTDNVDISYNSFDEKHGYYVSYPVVYGSVPLNDMYSEAFADIRGVNHINLEHTALVDYISLSFTLDSYNDLHNTDIHLYRVNYKSSWHSILKEDGYTEGYNKGMAYGKDIGYTDGYTNGERDGLVSGWERGLKEGYDNGYDDGMETGYERGHTEGYDNGYEVGYSVGSTDGFNRGFGEGENKGYTDGYNQASLKYDSLLAGNVKEARKVGYDEGYKVGYATGHNFGYSQGTKNTNHFSDLAFGVTGAISNLVGSMFNFEILGVNLLALLGSLLFIGFVVGVLKFFI